MLVGRQPLFCQSEPPVSHYNNIFDDNILLRKLLKFNQLAKGDLTCLNSTSANRQLGGTLHILKKLSFYIVKKASSALAFFTRSNKSTNRNHYLTYIRSRLCCHFDGLYVIIQRIRIRPQKFWMQFLLFEQINQFRENTAAISRT